MTAPPQWDDPNPPETSDPHTRIVLGVAAAALTAVVLAVLVGVVVTKRGVAFGGADRDPVTLVAANHPGPGPFLATSAATSIAVSEKATQEIRSTVGELPTAAERGVRLASGARALLYGGTADGVECDTAAIANQLRSRPDRSASWVVPLRLEPAEVPYYLNVLTPAVLTADTWVTAHSAAAPAHQAVLQAGTGVLVDPAGVPRVHCASGDPLAPPANRRFTELAVDGRSWPGFTPADVVAIAYSDAPASFTDPVPNRPLNEFVLLDLASGEPLVRPVGGTLDLTQLPPGGPLPDPIAMNSPATP